jgi:uncharacterized protein
VRGFGVFARQAIPSGTRVLRYCGRPRRISEIPVEVWERCFQFDYDVYLVPRRGGFGWYLNHSCEPNCVVRGARDIVTSRRVAKGEELTFDYSTNTGWRGYRLECRCGSRGCRGVVTSYWGLGPEARSRYGRAISPFLLRGEPSDGKPTRL